MKSNITTRSETTRIDNTLHNVTEKYNKKYFITIRKHQVKDYVDVQEIMNIIEFLMNKLPSLRLGSNSFEVDKKHRQLHFHSIVYLNEYLRYKAVSSFGGFRIFWKPVYDTNKLLKYITKDCNNKYKQEEIIFDNFYEHPLAPNRFIN